MFGQVPMMDQVDYVALRVLSVNRRLWCNTGMIEQSEPNSFQPSITVVGAGLAGAEAAWQAAQRGARVTLYEMRPGRMTPAHESDRMAELVCSNSLGSNLPDRALGLLKNELRRLGSLIIACADRTAVPAGAALAVGREAFSQAVTEAVEAHPNITVRREEVTAIPDGVSPIIIATGPLSSPALAEAIRGLAGQDSLYFFDAMAPIVTAESVDLTNAWRGNRWQDRGQGTGVRGQDRVGPGAEDEESTWPD